jgi:choline-sulfatase
MKWKRAALLAIVASGTLACGRKKNLVLITFDTTRADHMGYATGRSGVTPTLDVLAGQGSWFSTCLTAYPLTLPSHTSIMTGLYPYHHAVRNNGTYVVPKSDTTLAEILHARGYATHAIVSAFVLDSQFGLDQGFDEYDDDLSGGPKQKMFMFKEIKATQTADKAIKWLSLDRPKEKPFFLWVHFFDPHADYEPPPDVAVEFPGDPYTGEIHYADRELGRVLDALGKVGLAASTDIVFTSDHGDGLGEHGERTRGFFIYDSTTRVPLVFSGPGVPARRRVDTLVRTVDIVPTVLDLLGIRTPSGLDGESAVPLWNGRLEKRTAYTETLVPRLNFGWAELRGLRSNLFKVIDAPRPEAYDLLHDPHENRNLISPGTPFPDLARGLMAEVRGISHRDSFSRGGQREASVDAETKKKLAALGYLWASDSNAVGPRPDPKDRIGFWDRFEQSQDLIRNGALPEANQELTQLLSEDPNNVLAMGSLANVLSRSGQKDSARAIFERILSLDPDRDTAYLGVARIDREQRNFDGAADAVRKLIERQPKNPDAYVAMGDVFLDQDKYTDAEPWFRKARTIDPHSMTAASGLGNCLNRAGRLRDALEVLTDAHKHDATNHPVTYDLAVVTERLGDQQNAMKLYKEAVVLDPEHSMSWNNLGSLLDKMGRHDEALTDIQKAHDLDHENVEATYNLGALLLSRKQPEKALPYFDEAIARRPDLLQAAAMKARALTALDRNGEALETWKKVAQKNPVAFLQVARLEAEMGRTREARASLARAVAASPKARQAAEKDPRLKPLLR